MNYIVIVVVRLDCIKGTIVQRSYAIYHLGIEAWDENTRYGHRNGWS